MSERLIDKCLTTLFWYLTVSSIAIYVHFSANPYLAVACNAAAVLVVYVALGLMMDNRTRRLKRQKP